MKTSALNLQDVFLNQARKEKIAITIFLMNGVQLKGSVKGFDNYIVILEFEGKQQMIYKHAISTIIPAKSIPLMQNH
ncbi:RNA chaperone Hfq [Peptostreptococcaceae bacterium AGR-M142]